MIILQPLIRALLTAIAALPFPLLYLLSDVLRLIVQHIVRYRRKTILTNLRNAFPMKQPKEIKKIMTRYYRNLADITLEVIKLKKISHEELNKRFLLNDIDVLLRSFDNNRSVILVLGHCGNWEWMAAATGPKCPVKTYSVFKPLSNRFSDHFLQELRHRYNPGSTIPFRHAYRNMLRNRDQFITCNILVADQTPGRTEIIFRSWFLNQDTPFYMGVEKLARSLDFDVVFMDIVRERRGYYKGNLIRITDQPVNTEEFEIVERYIRLLENSINSNPDNWLWSHRRWKYQRPGMGQVL